MPSKRRHVCSGDVGCNREMINRLINRIFESPLGQVICGLDASTSSIESIATNKYGNGESETFRIGEYKIELVEFKIRQPLYNGETVADSVNTWLAVDEFKRKLETWVGLF